MKHVLTSLLALFVSITAIAAAVTIQPASGPAAEAIDVAGRGIASKADEALKKEVAKYARDNLFGITGTLKPAGDVSFVRGGLCSVDGKTGIALEFRVHARAKIDVGGGWATRKIWAVDTVQIWQAVMLPKVRDDGKLVAEVRIEQISATATKERQAKTQHAEGFRDTVTKAIKAKLDKFSGELDLGSLMKSLPN